VVITWTPRSFAIFGLALAAQAACVPVEIQGPLAPPPDAGASPPLELPDAGADPLWPDAEDPYPPEEDAGPAPDALPYPDAQPYPDASPDAGIWADASTTLPDEETDPLALAGLPTGAAQLSALCARNQGDLVSLAFCGPTPPVITSLTDLLNVLGLGFRPGNNANATNGNPGFALTSHSSSLVTRFTSPINPRAIIFTPARSNGRVRGTPQPNPTYVALGFVRGEQFVELVSKDPTAGGVLRFFLFRFEQACNQRPGGCTPGDLLTPAVESGFTSYTLYQDDDIKNTVFDCAQCHQPNGPGTPKILRMQELQFPWTHFLFNEPAGNVLLRDDFRAAHPNEPYAGIPAAAVPNAAPPRLEAFVENNGFQAQPNEFQTGTISMEVSTQNAQQPTMNIPPGISNTWNMLYNNYLAGNAIPPPYHDFRVTDPTKLANMTAAYRAVMTGAMPAAQLPDIRDVFLDAALPDMTIRPRPGSTGRQILVQMCQQCHNSKLDQSISRARFNVETLDQMSRLEKDIAIARIQLPKNAARLMPPERFRELSPAEIALVTQELMR
jgi:mono/diheme cytochrome c family protein